MSKEHHARLRELFLAARERPAEERSRFLAAARGVDAELCREVESLLAHDDAAGAAATKSLPAPPLHPTGQRLLPGSDLGGRYRLVKLLGRGGMGEVYRADDLKLGVAVALKILPADLARAEERLSLLLNEVRLARQITHPNVCRIHDVGEQGGLHFISMELIDGEDLEALLRRGRLPCERAVDIARGLCAGLDAAHAQGILHHDLKPANLMIDERGEVRITDFGISLRAGAGGRSFPAKHAGTPAYMAPEQYTGGIEVSVRTDLYAVGLVLYELFTGRRAFEADSLGELGRLHREAAPTPPSAVVADLDPTLEKVILRCLEKDPRDRPASAQAVASALPGRVALAEGTVLKAILMTDLADGAHLVEQLGDAGSDELFERYERLTRDLVREHGGLEVDKTDGFLLLFERPIHAVLFAQAYHEALAELSRPQRGAAQGIGGGRPQARIGIHLGEVAVRRNPSADVARGAKPFEVAGLARPMAARLMALAEGGQTLLSRTAFDVARRSAVGETARAAELAWLAHGRYVLAGVEEPVEVFEVGEEGASPLSAPAGSERARRVLGEDVVLGWRPAPGGPLPGRAHWIVDKKLGEGGFGEVWLAVHRKTRERRVFKFCYEVARLRSLQREITLFRLLKEELGEREDIARIFDWNFDDAPFFIESEYTPGGNLEEWAEARGGIAEVALDERLEIVAQVAEAVAAAHSVGVLHKDVKPSNVLIWRDAESRTRARLTDFGIGAVTERQRLAAAGITMLGMTEATRTGSSSEHSGTRLYIAPEVLEGKQPTLQADIYALGVMLYQLVTGDFSRALAPGWRDEIGDDLLVQDIASAAQRSPEKRLRDASQLAERLRTLNERRARREAAEAARRELQKAQRRHKLYGVVTAVTIVVLAAVSAFAIWAVSMRRKEEVARLEAERSRQSAERVAEFMVELFEITDPYGTSDPGAARGGEITAREILDRGASKLETELGEEPLIRARLMHTVGDVYLNLGLYDSAQSLIEKALTLRREILGEEHLDTAESLVVLATMLSARGDREDAELLHRQALTIRRRLLGGDHPDIATSMVWVASMEYDMDRAEVLHREALAMRRRLYGDEHLDVAESLMLLATCLTSRNDYEGAEPLAREALAMRRRLLGDEHPLVALSLDYMTRTLMVKGDFDGAEPLAREALAMRRRLLGGDDISVAASLFTLARVLFYQGDQEGGEALAREELAMTRRLLGEKHPRVADRLTNLGWMLQTQGKYEGAERLIREALAIQRRLFGDEHPAVAGSLNMLAFSLQLKGDYENAEPLNREALAMRRRLLGDEDPAVATSLHRLARLRLARGDGAEAEELIREALGIYRRHVASGHWEIASAESILGASFAQQGRYEEAESLLLRSYPILRDQRGEKHIHTRDALERLVVFYETWGKPEKAAEYRALWVEEETRRR